MEEQMFAPLIRAVRGALVEYGSAGEACVVAVSGGVDSMVLLHLASRVAREAGMSVHAVHVHHGLRSAADRDAALVRDTAAAWGIQAQVRRVDLNMIPQAERRGVEADARALRYAALRDAAQSVGARVILLAHHADDQLETMLWRLVRGTSPRGLAGMRPVRERWGLIWVRPLLPFEKRVLVAYAKAHEIPWVEDETNADPRFVRNAIRLEVVPVLRRLQPSVAPAAARLAALMQAEDEWLESEARRWLDANAKWDASSGTWQLTVAALCEAPVALQRRAVHILLCCLTSAEWAFAHVQAILDLAQGPHPSAEVVLPHGLRAWRVYGDLYIGARASGASSTAEAMSDGPLLWSLVDGGELRWPEEETDAWRFHCTSWAREQEEPLEVGPKAPSTRRSGFGGLWCLWLPAEVQTLMVRAPRHGDRIALQGMDGRKKLQDVFVDRKVPRWLRSRWPVLCLPDGEPLWLPGLARSRRCLVLATDVAGWCVKAVPPAGHGQASMRVSST